MSEDNSGMGRMNEWMPECSSLEANRGILWLNCVDLWCGCGQLCIAGLLTSAVRDRSKICFNCSWTSFRSQLMQICHFYNFTPICDVNQWKMYISTLIMYHTTGYDKTSIRSKEYCQAEPHIRHFWWHKLRYMPELKLTDCVTASHPGGRLLCVMWNLHVMWWYLEHAMAAH